MTPEDRALFHGQPWAPSRFTAPLRPDVIVSDGFRLIELVERYMKTPEGPVRLRGWQKALLVAVLERYPLDWHDRTLAGQLRYRQVVISVARQNGKSLLGAIFALYGLLQHVKAPSVIGLATSVEQANVVYNRVKYAVEHHPMLLKRLRATGTRGISRRDGAGQYLVKPALREGLQSVPITFGVADELHLMAPALWDSIVQGQRAQRSALIAGITTAGDESSILLKRLYRVGSLALAGKRERFGFFVWEAEEGATIADDAALIAANPMVADGWLPIATVRSDVIDQPKADQQRYALNRFPDASTTAAWWDGDQWANATTDQTIDQAAQVTIGVAREPGWSAATIVAAQRTDDGAHVHPIATLVNPSTDQLEAVLEHLAATLADAAFVMDRSSLGALAKRLKDSGHEVWSLTDGEQAEAASAMFAAVSRGRLSHDGNPIAAIQWATTKRHNVADRWRLATTAGSDVTRAMTNAWWVAGERREAGSVY